MLRRIVLTVLLCFGATTLLAGAAAAQKPKPGAGKGGGGKLEQKRAKLREKVRQLRNAKLIAVLDLDEASATKLFTLLNKYDDLIQPLRLEIAQARRELKQMVASGKIDGARVDKLVDQIEAARVQIEKYDHQRVAEARKILSPKQVAVLVVVWPEIEREIEREIRRAAKKGAGALEDLED